MRSPSPRLCAARMLCLGLAGFGLFLGSPCSIAQEAAPSDPPTFAPRPLSQPKPLPLPPPSSDGLGRLGAYFAILITLAGGGLYVLKNGLPIRGMRTSTERKLQIQEMRSLGNRQFLVVVEYEDTKVLLGVTPGKIDYLCPLGAHPAVPTDFASLVAQETKSNP